MLFINFTLLSISVEILGSDQVSPMSLTSVIQETNHELFIILRFKLATSDETS